VTRRRPGNASPNAFLDEVELVKTPPRPVRRDLDSLPLPAWDLVDVERYRSAWLERHDFFSARIALPTSA
jgi:hypothetical protein